MQSKRTRVLIVDDSALVRQMMTSILSSDPEIEVVGCASDPLMARTRIKELNPDVITLDIEMPRMDGLEFLEKVMSLRPMPVVMVSSLTQKGADAALKALEIGAVDFVGKPVIDLQVGMTELKAEIIAKVKQAAHAKVRPFQPVDPAGKPATPAANMRFSSTDKIIAIGASTGGVEAVKAVLHAMPAGSPGIIVTQHMPGNFTGGFARRLDQTCALKVVEATDGARILSGHAYIAPGGQHMRIERSGGLFITRIGGTDRVSGHCPSVDVMFESVAREAAHNAIGVILTGMGRDGAEGLLAMRKAGAHTLGQDEASCVVYGMPKAAWDLGGVEEQLPLEKMTSRILSLVQEQREKSNDRRTA